MRSDALAGGGESTRQASLATDQERVLDVFEHGEACIVLDADFRIVLVNEEQERLSRTRRADTLGRIFWEAFPEAADPGKPCWHHYHRAMRDRVPLTFEDHYEPLDVWTDVRVYPTREGGIAAFFHDATERKRAEAQRDQHQEMLESVIERIPVMVVIHEPGLRSMRFNEELRRVLGWTDEDARREDFLSGPYPDPDVREQVRRFMEAAEPVWREFVVVAKDGERIPTAWANVRLSDRTRIGIGLDLRERKEAERALRESEERLRFVVGSSPDNIFVQDADLRYVWVARPAWPLTREEYLGQTDFDLMGREDAQHLADIKRTVMEAGRGTTVEVPLVLKGEHLVFEATYEPWRDGRGGVIGVAGYVRDITARTEAAAAVRQSEERLRQANERLEEADRRKNEFLAMLSHELRNPLAPIRNCVHILERAVPGGEQARRALAVIGRQVGHMTRLIDDLLDVTRISKGKINLQRERVDLDALARATAEDHRELFAKHGVELVVEEAGEPLHVNGDPARLAQVIGNLLSNAVKFTPRGGHARMTLQRGERGDAILRVRDDGAGIAPEALERIFEPFMQGETTLDRSRGGLGLGLALVKWLIELHGGTVTAESRGLGEGATFVVRLPLEAEATTDRAGRAP